MSQDKRFTFSYLALCNLERRPFRTAALMILVSILSFVLFAGSLISLSLKNGTDRLSKRLGADILVVPKGYEQRAEKILLRGEPSTFYMNAAWTKKISGIAGVGAVSPQLFVASLNASCCSATIQMIGFDQDTDFTVGPWIKSELPGKLADDEIVVGANISGAVGVKRKFFGRDYIVAGKMDNTGTGFDTSIFMNIEAAKKAAIDYVVKTGAVGIPQDAISSVTVLIKEGYSVNDVAKNISDTFDPVNSGIAVITAERITSMVSASLRLAESFVIALGAIFWVLAVLILGIVFSISLNERKREFGILRSLGATKKKLASLMLLESGVISLFGGALGIGFCTLFILPFRGYVLQAMNMPYLQPSTVQLAMVTIMSLILSAATGPVSSVVSVVKISRGDAYAAIRDGAI